VSFLVAVLGLGLLVFVHELGHFGASLALGMRPRKFYVGFPPAIAKTTRHGIEYGIGAVPLGGFVKIPGMHRPAPADVDAQLGRAVIEAPDLAGPVDRLRRLLATGDHEGARRSAASLRALIEARELSAPARGAADKGLAELEDALGPDAYWRAATWRRVIAIAAGPLSNVVLTLILLVVLFATSGGKATTRVDHVNESSPAAKTGLRPGDRILAVDGTPILDAADIPDLIGASLGRPITLTVVRDGVRVNLRPQAPKLQDGTYRLGFALRGVGQPVPEAIGSAFRVTGEVSRDIVGTIGHLATGKGRNEISSPVGIVKGSSDAAREGTESYLSVLALISLSIALLNLLPLLPLDGGHIVFAVAEGIRGRAVRREIYERVSVVGIALVLFLFVIGLSNDIPHITQ
jgi:regulator of sigma E protease